jgi:repressor LexA
MSKGSSTDDRGAKGRNAKGRDATVAELPDGAPDAAGLTPRQRRVLAHIKDSIESRGYPPSMREIGEAVGLTSSSSVAHQLKVLEQKGFLRRDPNRPRALEVFLPEVMAARRSISTADDSTFDSTGVGDMAPAASLVPVVGRIAAGGPILAEERVEDVFPLPKQIVGEGTLFLLQVSGDSMVDAAICHGDYVVIRQQASRRSSGAPARCGCCRTTTPTIRSMAPTHRSSARSPLSFGGSETGALPRIQSENGRQFLPIVPVAGLATVGWSGGSRRWGLG